MMNYMALATDYDGTAATDGRLMPATRAALEQLRASGRRALLVTGRELDDLARVMPHFELFDRIVAENGAVLHRPASGETIRLAEPPPPAFVERLRAADIAPLSVGEVIVATTTPHETYVLEVIRELGLELQIIFNKGSVMVLPPGVNKASGLAAALAELKLSPHNVVAVGDAENDHALLAQSGCAVAVANALPMLKEAADLVTTAAEGAGVAELIGRLTADDLRSLEPRLHRHNAVLARRVGDRAELPLPAHGANLLIAGSSGGGKTSFATGLLERLCERGFQVVAIDPEGDYEAFEPAIKLGNAEQPPDPDAVVDVLDDPSESVVINLLGVAFEDRPACFGRLLPRLQQLRAETGRPHWMLLDEAHHLLPAGREAATVPAASMAMALITLDPAHVAPSVLDAVDLVVALGDAPADILRGFARAVGMPAPAVDAASFEPGTGLLWDRRTSLPPVRIEVIPPDGERRRHARKYAEGRLSADRSFFFRGPEGRLNLRAQNLTLFSQLADGVDDDTWQHHLRRGDYSRWFRTAIKDAELADEAAAVERASLPPAESRARIRAAVDRRYTGPS